MTTFRVDTKQITDWASFHLIWKEAFDFPDYYGENMNAWIDCMSDLVIDKEIIHVEITDTKNFNWRLPEIFDSLTECTAFVNNRFIGANETVKIALIFF